MDNRPVFLLIGACLLLFFLAFIACDRPAKQQAENSPPPEISPTPAPAVTPAPQPPDNGIVEIEMEAVTDETPGAISPEPTAPSH